METEEKIGSAQAEIDLLKKRIAELEASPSSKKETDIVREVIKEHIEKKPEQILEEKHRIQTEEIKRETERISGLKTGLSLGSQDEPHQRQVLELLQYAQSKGVLNATAIVKNIGDPHLEDDFHDALVKFFQGIKNV